ncbi:hypothetical protein E4631_10105 [Hymenobacter sp. UV11]|uniref:SWIM zinc finger family protein n=1 Tax=Hymenobacter sp. UV11 TaxID=1849735 RepID=UPI00105EC237|nr:hypothetical protein [Hymenobacter sp. UV11]TDN40613.1 hypothetical protein A8B98_14440 [Hymenobacter sp. UV11]TFZ66367.1 hypothetical protein E4631_10105 [Hymenobacter sp. UV11]
MITQQTLRRLAEAKVFARGQALYDAGAVHKLARAAPTRFSARVQGTYRYSVQLWLASGAAEFSCDCAYDWDGICKHSVALGLAVLATYGNSLGQLPAETAAPTPSANANAADLPAQVARAWAARPEAERLRFLELALRKSDDLARQFLAFGEPAAPEKKAKAPDPTKHLAERLRDTLEALEFGDEFFESNPDYGYDEGDALVEGAYELVREELHPFAAELLALARGGQLKEALRYWATACGAIFQVEEPASDDYGAFGDYGQEALDQWQEVLATEDWPLLLTTAVLPAREVKSAITWLTKHLANPPARWPDFDATWQPLLEALAADPTAAPLFPALLNAAQLAPATLAHLRRRLARTLADDAAWLATAETLVADDAQVARQLLSYYANQGDLPARLRTATTAFATWPDQFAGYVLSSFAVDQAPTLYPAALRYRTLANHSLDDFAALHPLLSEAETTALVREAVAAAAARRGSVAFAAELLARTADVAGLRTFVLGLEWLHVSPPYHSEIALMCLAAVDPTPLMLELETRLPAYLNGRAGAKRGAFLYERIGRWLVSMRGTAPRLTEPVLRLAQELRTEFPTLHGLRDVLRREGLLVAAEPDVPVIKKKSGRNPS